MNRKSTIWGIVALTLSLLIMTGCSKDNDEATLSISTLEGGAVNFTDEALSDEAVEITVSTNQTSWNAVSNQTWCKVDKQDKKFTVTADPQTEPTDRTATITVSAGTASPINIVVNQSGFTIRSYDLSALIVDGTGNLGGTITMTKNGRPVAGVPVTLSYRTHGGSGTAASTDIALGKSSAAGIVTVGGELEDKTPRVIEFSTDNYTTSTRITFGTVPVGFLTGKATDLTTLAEARVFAAFHGGKLPLVGGKTVYKWGEYVAAMNTTTVDGFGYYNASSWPSDLPTTHNGNLVSYWTNTEDTEYGGNEFWLITPNNGKVAPGTAMTIATEKFAVTCLP